MDLDEYERATEATDVRPDPTDPALPLLGLAGEVGSLVTEYKKKLRGGGGYTGFEREVGEDLGDLLWYAATLARTVGLSLDEIASANLSKTASMWSEQLSPARQYDAAFPPGQRLPRQFTMTFVSVTGKDGLPRVKIYMGAEARGDPLDDNSYEDDHYRFHDALHLAHAAVLGWSVGVKNSDHPCDLRLRPIWPPVRSARIAFPEARVRTRRQPSWLRSESEGLKSCTERLRLGHFGSQGRRIEWRTLASRASLESLALVFAAHCEFAGRAHDRSF